MQMRTPFLTCRSMTKDISVSDASLAQPYHRIPIIQGPAAGAERSLSAEFTPSPRRWKNELPRWISHCRGSRVDRNWWWQLHRSCPSAARRTDSGGSGRNGFLVCWCAALDRGPVLFAREANTFALPLASAARSSSGPLTGHLGASLIESRRGESIRNRGARHSPGGVIQRDLYQANTKSGVCCEKPPLASLARIAHWS